MSDEGSMVFEPAFIKINAGDSITFEMTDAGHNAATVYGPAGSVPFDTKYKPSTTIKFDVSGLYLYKCSPHAMMAMAGIIQVSDTNNKSEIILHYNYLSISNSEIVSKIMYEMKEYTNVHQICYDSLSCFYNCRKSCMGGDQKSVLKIKA